MNLSEITVKKKETNELVTRIFEDEEGIKEITSDNYIVEIKENGWIPVEEKMPNYMQRVLVTYIGYFDQKHYCDGVAYYDFLDQWMWVADDTHVCVEIIAWMPLPESYQGEEK